MLLPQAIAAGVAEGTVTLAFRRWAAPRVTPGSRFLTSVGLIEVVAIDEAGDEVTDEDAVAAGAVTPAARLRLTAGDPEVPLYRIVLAWAGEDPRIALRERSDLSDEDADGIAARLDRLDRASGHGDWTRATLALIARHPGRRAAELAATAGRETLPFKVDVRKLKALGLTVSLEVGYELSPRGRAFLARGGPGD